MKTQIGKYKQSKRSIFFSIILGFKGALSFSKRLYDQELEGCQQALTVILLQQIHIANFQNHILFV